MLTRFSSVAIAGLDAMGRMYAGPACCDLPEPPRKGEGMTEVGVAVLAAVVGAVVAKILDRLFPK
jgi:hypothetical protein